MYPYVYRTKRTLKIFATLQGNKILGDFMQRTDWHRICVFKPHLRESVSTYLKKGQRVLVVGKISYGEFKDEQGITKPSTAVIADDVIFFQSS